MQLYFSLAGDKHPVFPKEKPDKDNGWKAQPIPEKSPKHPLANQGKTGEMVLRLKSEIEYMKIVTGLMKL